MNKRELIFFIWALFATLSCAGMWQIHKPFREEYQENVLLNEMVKAKIEYGDSIMAGVVEQKTKLDSLILVNEQNEKYIEKGDFRFLAEMYGGGNSFGGKN